MTFTSFMVALALSVLAFGGVVFGSATGSAALGASMPRSVTVGLGVVVAVPAFGFFASAQQPTGSPRAWLWLVAMVISLSVAAISIRWWTRSQGRTGPPRLSLVIALGVIPLLGFIGALLAIVLAHAPNEILLLPAALLALSVAGRLWLANSNEPRGFG